MSIPLPHHSFASLGVEDKLVAMGGPNCLGNPNSKEFGYSNGSIPANRRSIQPTYFA